MDDSYWQSLLQDAESELGPAKGSGGEARITGGMGGGSMPTGARYQADAWALRPRLDEGAGERAGERGDEPADEEADWERAQELLSCAQPIEVTISGYNRGGLLAYFGSIPAFLPASHLINPIVVQAPPARIAALASHIGDKVTVKVIEIDRERRRLILSERCAQTGDSVESLLASFQPGQRVRGKVTNLCAFGAFVELGGFEGLIHISELSWGRVNVPSEVVQPGDEVEVMVLEVNATAQKVALSLKRLRPDPWRGLEERYHVGQVIDAVITNVVSFGAFARLEEGLEGLIHISELAEGSFMHPRNVVNEGDKVRVRVLQVDGARHRLALTMRCTDMATRIKPAEFMGGGEWQA